MTDPTTLTALATSAITALIPLLKRALGKGLETLGDKAAGKAFEALKHKLHHSSAEKALEKLADHPDDNSLQLRLRVHLEESMEQDSKLAEAVRHWLDEVKQAESHQTASASDQGQAAVADHGGTVIQIQGSGNNVTR